MTYFLYVVNSKISADNIREIGQEESSRDGKLIYFKHDEEGGGDNR